MSLHLPVDSLIVWIVVAVLGSLIASLAAPLCRRVLAQADPTNRSLLMLLYALTPYLSALIVVVLQANPSLATNLVPHHCHHQACAPHTPEVVLHSVAGTTLIVVSLLATTFVAVSGTLGLIRLCHKLKVLHHFSHGHQTISYRTINDPTPFAWCSGLFRQQIYISTGLISRVTEDQLRAVLMHESVHKERMDNLRKTIVHLANCFWFGAKRRQFAIDFEDALESTCHDIAASRLKGSSLLNQVSSILGDDGSHQKDKKKANACEFTATPSVTTRCVAIYAPGWLFVCALWVLEVVVFTGPTHIGLEWLTIGQF